MTVLQDLGTRIAEAHRRHAPLRLRGAGTKDFYSERLEGDILDLRAYTGIVDYEPSELVVVARCGTPLSELETLLAGHQQYLPFEPPAFGGDPTIGGAVAAGLSGPRRQRVGAARDFVLGAVLLDVNGETLHFGGKVMKNVAGYDISRLLCGSLGILGPLVEVSIKVLPRPRAEQTLCFEMSDRDALSIFNDWSGQPLPISACAWFAGRAYVQLSGSESALRTARERLGGELLAPHTAAAWWGSVRHQTHAFFREASNLWRLSVPATTPPLALPTSPFIEWGGALRWYACNQPAADIRAIAVDAGGTATHWRGENSGQRFHPLNPGVLHLHRQLKNKFDPHGIFNRGRLVNDF